MSMQKTRREFLRSTAVGLATVATVRALPISDVDASSHAGEIAAWVTSEKGFFAPRSGLRWQTASAEPREQAIVLNPDKAFQTILGFGAAFTDAACYTFNRLSPSSRESLFHELFYPSEMGLNVCRTCMGSSDYSTKVYSYDEGDADPELELFSIQQVRQYILPILR
jgi:glucosylceramidase